MSLLSDDTLPKLLVISGQKPLFCPPDIHLISGLYFLLYIQSVDQEEEPVVIVMEDFTFHEVGCLVSINLSIYVAWLRTL